MATTSKTLLPAAALMLLLSASTFTDAAIITNGAVILGITDKGNLNTGYRAVTNPVTGSVVLPGADPAGVGAVGLRSGDGRYTSTEQGCLCEGWGVSANGALAMFADESTGTANVNVISTSGIDGGSTFVSVTEHPSNSFRVTHDYHPTAATPYLMECKVTIENKGTVPLTDVRYRRVMDWDIDPTPFGEYVTIELGATHPANFLASTDNGFCGANPLDPCSAIIAPVSTSFTDSGPADHGACFDFTFGTVNPGGKVEFFIYYGAAPSEVAALGALGAAKAELYSLGQQSGSGGKDAGTPFTFMFAFAGVGGTPVIPINHAPVITSATTDVTLLPVNTPLTFKVIFTDEDAGDTHSVKIFWDKAEDPTVTSEHTLTVGDRSYTTTHTYTKTGFYEICVDVSDGTDTDHKCVTAKVVVYDPLGPSIQGNGCYDTPASSYPALPAAAGSVTFSLKAGYPSATATKPTGDIKLTFKNGGWEFRAKIFYWLVVEDGTAVLYGRGCFVGSTEYFDFKLTVVNGSPDTFRLKLVRDSGEVVYDNLVAGHEDMLKLTKGDVVFL